MKTMEELMTIVNNATTFEKIREARIILDGAMHISNEEYDQLMMALACQAREARKR